jgi:large subunit ribosomal protein L1
MGHGKRYTDSLRAFDREQLYGAGDAIRILRSLPEAKFDETVELTFRLGVDPRQADQNVRGTVALPHGTGKEVRVAAFAQGDKAREAKEAGADLVGGEELVQEVVGGSIDFEAAVATPDMMPVLGKAGRVLGPRGLMPNPKAGTVTQDIGKAVREIKAGKLEYRVDRQANVHVAVGKRSFEEKDLIDNYLAVVDEILRAKPASSKGRYLRSVTISTTHGPGIKIDPSKVKDVSESIPA